MYTKILVTLDGSAIAEQALPHGQAIAQAFGAELVLLRVNTPIPHVPHERYPEDLAQIAANYLAEIASGLAKGGLEVEAEVKYGEAAETILDYVGSHHVDLIVMSTHGHSGLSQLIFGSVTQQVLHGAEVPVLVVRAQEPSAA